MNILIGIPSCGTVNPKFAYDSLPAIIAYTRDTLPNVKLFLDYQTGVMTAKNRNLIVQNALNRNDIDYILWLDEDMIYPMNIISKYLEHKPEIIGCLYFRRSEPHQPIGYRKSSNPLKPFNAIDPRSVPDNIEIIDVDGLGYGGMMVSMDVYRKMGEDKWTHYGENFHKPYKCEGQLSHDLQFCRDAQKYGVKIQMHTKVRPWHIGEKLINEVDWTRRLSPKRPIITVLMPAIDIEASQKTAKLMKSRAGMDCDVIIAEDVNRSGYMATINRAIKEYPSDFYVYTATDAFVGNDWLLKAHKKMESTNAGLLAFNNGRWGDRMAAFGMVRHSWLIGIYGGDLFYSGYNCHYGDVELSIIAKAQDRFAYDPDSTMTEVDYDKDKKGVNLVDRKLFNERKKTGFGGKVNDPDLLDSFK